MDMRKPQPIVAFEAPGSSSSTVVVPDFHCENAVTTGTGIQVAHGVDHALRKWGLLFEINLYWILFIGEPDFFAEELANVTDLPLSDMTAASLNTDFFSQTAPLASSNTGFFLQALVPSPDMDFFTMADHAIANAYDSTNVGGVINHSDAVLDNFLGRFGPFDDFQV